MKFKLDLFEDPYKYCCEDDEAQVNLKEEHLAAARDAAKKSIVLLKNNNNVLQKVKFVYQKKGTTNVHFGQYFKPFK